jgi:hypothetical protein
MGRSIVRFERETNLGVGIRDWGLGISEAVFLARHAQRKKRLRIPKQRLRAPAFPNP